MASRSEVERWVIEDFVRAASRQTPLDAPAAQSAFQSITAAADAHETYVSQKLRQLALAGSQMADQVRKVSPG